jgi:hypothetical protein
MVWNYLKAEWTEGAKVTLDKRDGREFLRSDPDTTVSDNLRNLIPMEKFF